MILPFRQESVAVTTFDSISIFCGIVLVPFSLRHDEFKVLDGFNSQTFSSVYMTATAIKQRCNELNVIINNLKENIYNKKEITLYDRYSSFSSI